MARDIILGRIHRNWSINLPSRGQIVSDEVTFRLTQPEMDMLAEISATKLKAKAGDSKAKKKMAKLSRNLAKVEKRAARGDARAKRTLRVLKESGALVSVTAMTMGGEEIPNILYRAAILKQASKSAGSRKPSTKDFFRAKSAVDKVMGKAGITLYLPGARPGRITA